MAGRLTLVATPIGNLGDLSPRALAALAEADVIACEDTRRTGMLLSRHGLASRRMIIVNEHTELDRIPQIIAMLGDGLAVAVVSDAGSPGISDPGERLVAATLDAGYDVTSIPGPSAVVMGLSLSGLPTGRFVFEGFLPRSGSGRTERLGDIARETRTVVLYEAPHRLARTVADLAAGCEPTRRIALARELTKLHEELWRGTLADAVRHTTEHDPIGEYVIVLEGAPSAGPADDDSVRAALRDRFAAGDSTKSAVAEVSAALRVRHRHVYQLALSLDRSAGTAPIDGG